MKLKDYNLVKQYIIDKIDTDYLSLNRTEKFRQITKYLKEIFQLIDADDYIITECDNNVIIFCFITEYSIDGNNRKWFDFYINDILMDKRKKKLNNIISLIG